ncbi:MAG: hypothetical protein ACR2N2_08385 [Acidimicrobiia bacterium]
MSRPVFSRQAFIAVPVAVLLVLTWSERQRGPLDPLISPPLTSPVATLPNKAHRY